jgi:hypothetical protein
LPERALLREGPGCALKSCCIADLNPFLRYGYPISSLFTVTPL